MDGFIALGGDATHNPRLVFPTHLLNVTRNTPMANLLDVVVFAVFIVILLQLSRPESLRTQDVKIWSDDVERRMMR